ncbi:glycoside hydrolase N-terminal domain-containing protein [Rathayibacter sp. VKM Ac-2929]|uniref:glycosyl hydrolase family 95 catalytic domain-containing protein n=1 Tax=Rathayibacter sp. VKM Ac-2929 TaxID=2929480 RepID=UPI001FB2DB88|nr:glycoside hydrolase N-terminal domain-containing protein [Rathayibacter sp. VKM Ac-2929]MCJ1675525.1 glycoside hydrolase N-terminal domain-containing protein [Rathayibacter sp. VKM Ac-2929]
MSRAAWSALTAKTWEEGLLAGTGVVGGILYGDPPRHVVALAHEDFFVPANSRVPAPLLAPALPAVRRALADGDSGTAADLVEKTLREQGWDPDTLIWTDPLGAIAQLEWQPDHTNWSAYRRDISLINGDAGVSWELPSGARTGLSISTSHGTAGFDVELWSEEPISGRLRLVPVHEAGSSATTVLPVDYSDTIRTRTAATESVLIVIVEALGLEPGTGASAQARVISEAPHEPDGENTWRVEVPASGCRFRIDVTTTYDSGSDHVLADIASLLPASELTLAGSTSADEPTERIWEDASAGAVQAEARVLELAYLAGLRNIAVSTGSLPPTLQGVWQGTWSPAWSADYTMNGNVQLGALAAVLWTGTPEVMTSLFRLVRRYLDHYRSNARRIFGQDGMLLPARMTTHGHANHFLRDYPHQFWLGNGPWFLRLAADYIQVTGDRTILDDWLWDLTIEILDFSRRVIDDAGGILSPSYSPENTPAGSENPLVADATADIAALRDGYRVGAWFAELRGDTHRAAEWSAARSRLPQFAIVTDGTLAEWSTRWPENIAHRHVSQLHGLWYEPDEAFTDEKLRAAALGTVRAKTAWRAENPSGPPGHMEMAFGLSSIGLAAAALGDASSAYQCAVWLARDHFTPALSTTHDAGAIFNLDASGALPAVVAAMLLQSSRDTLHVLPALPSQWAAGTITGLTARGAVTVSRLSWTPDGIDLTLELSTRGEWLRPEGVTILLPRAGVLREAPNTTQIDSRSLVIQPGTLRVRVQADFTAS